MRTSRILLTVIMCLTIADSGVTWPRNRANADAPARPSGGDQPARTTTPQRQTSNSPATAADAPARSTGGSQPARTTTPPGQTSNSPTSIADAPQFPTATSETTPYKANDSFHSVVVVRGINAHALRQGIEQAQQTRLPLRIPEGRYRLTEPLVISRPVRIEAEEGAVLVAVWSGSAEPNHQAVIELTPEARGTVIDGLAINGQRNRLQGIRLRAVSDVEIINLRAHNLGMNGISIEAGCSRIHVKGAVLEATQQNELSVAGAVWIRDSQDITVERVQVRDTGGKGISIGRSREVTLRDCVVHDTAIGAGDGIYFAHAHDSLVDRCSVLDPQGNALKISRQSSGIMVQGSHFRKTRGHTGAHAVFIQGGSDNTITGNRIEGMTRRPAVRIEGHPDPEAGGPALRNVVSGNHIVSASKAAGPRGWFFSPGADHPEAIKTGTIYRDNVEERQ